MTSPSRELLIKNLRKPPAGRWNIHTQLKHFAIITYAIPAERLTHLIPEDKFAIETFEIDGERMALLSAVPFVDRKFHFPNLLPGIHFSFAQTNHRIYVRHRETNRRVAWFLGTSLGSRAVIIPQVLWGLPWHRAKYRVDCVFDAERSRYGRYRFDIQSRWCAAQIDLEDTGEPLSELKGFRDFDEMKLVLTHPIEGYYYRRRGDIGTYKIWHNEMDFTVARPTNLYFSLYEKLGILNREEMGQPHSAILCPSADFIIQLPPRVL
jgi:hypothetical protein